jgi:hypothetical protein
MMHVTPKLLETKIHVVPGEQNKRMPHFIDLDEVTRDKARRRIGLL